MTDAPQELANNSQPLRDENGKLLPGTPSLNPGGRPKGSYSIMTILRKKMEEIPLGQTKEWGHQIADIILDEAVVNRKSDMLKLIVNYMDGMPNQKVDFGVDKENIGELTELLGALAKKTDDKRSEPVGEGAQ
jgi:hypothetical protein